MRQANKLLEPIFKTLCLLELESKFKVRRPVNVSTPPDRNDKFFDYNLGMLQNNQEMALLNELSRSIFYIPFEINKKSQLNLQVSEQFQISYMDKSHD